MAAPGLSDVTEPTADDVTTVNYTDDGRLDSSDFYEMKRSRSHLNYNIFMGTLSIITSAVFILYLLVFCLNHKVSSQRASWLNLHAAFVVPLSVSITYAAHLTNVEQSWGSEHECIIMAFVRLASKMMVYMSFVVCAVERFSCTVRGLDDHPGLSKTTTYALMAMPWMIAYPLCAILCFIITQPKFFEKNDRIGCYLAFTQPMLAFTHGLAVALLSLVAFFAMTTVLVKYGPGTLRRFQHLLTDNNIAANVVGSIILVIFQTPYHLLTSPYAPKASALTHNAFFGMNFVGLAIIPLSWLVFDPHVRTSLIDMFQACMHNFEDYGICGTDSHVVLVGVDDD